RGRGVGRSASPAGASGAEGGEAPSPLLFLGEGPGVRASPAGASGAEGGEGCLPWRLPYAGRGVRGYNRRTYPGNRPGKKETVMAVTDEFLKANASYASTFNKGHLPMPPARKVAVLACMDARLDPAKALGLEEGDAHVIRNAGGRASEDAI